MKAYAIRRFMLIIPTMIILSLMLFTLFRMIPGDVVDAMVAEMGERGEGGEFNVEQLRAALGLNVPIHTQYGRWLGVWPQDDGSFDGILEGNFGVSLWTNIPLTETLREKIPVTVELSVLSLSLGLLFSIPIGVYAAIRQDSKLDYLARSWSILALAIPSFWAATMVIVYPAMWWNWMPPVEYIPLVEDPIANLGQFLLPAIIMGMFTSGGTMRITRTMMLEVLRQDYIRTAWSKGLRERVVVVRHALKNTLIPVITIVGGMVPGLFGGSVIMEQIFCLPGMGRFLLEAIKGRDYNVVCGHNLIFASFVMIVIVITDLAYAYCDPRIRYR